MNAVQTIPTTKQTEAEPPLAVDLDGTLAKTDLLLESILVLLKQKIWCALLLPYWLLKGKAYFKQQVARRSELDTAAIPYREDLLDYLKTERARGRMLILATAADGRIARRVADHLGIFDQVLASDGIVNLAGRAKRDRLVEEFGAGQFDYVGNGRCDLPVLHAARKAVQVQPEPHRLAADYLKPLRLQHWLKNLLVFVPLFAAHRFDEIGLLGKLAVAFLSFGCFASAGYLINDLLDLASDRHHPAKRLRPFAAGDLPLGYAFAMIPALAVLGLASALTVSAPFVEVVLSYFALSLTYSLRLKRIVVLDVIVLAGLYSMRILAGAAAVAIWPSEWLLAFSTFFFFSLALVKRYSELVIMREIDGDHARARSYELDDAELLAAMGVASGFLSVLVLALYINSEEAQALYLRYEWIWFLCPLLLYWIGRVWLIAHRGQMPDDPLVFATRDRTSYILILLMLALVALAL
jgi:4-hydroxybenzoate polyprenyltransferase